MLCISENDVDATTDTFTKKILKSALVGTFGRLAKKPSDTKIIVAEDHNDFLYHHGKGNIEVLKSLLAFHAYKVKLILFVLSGH